jgi:5'-nucleotidase
MSEPSILITNDDGIFASGIYALKQAMESLGRVTVVAPLSEKSAVGHAITISDPLRVETVERNGSFFGYAVNGTPADCVKLAVAALCEQKPDLVVSGINLGPNTATNILYSGTVSAAAEGAMLGIPSLAVSVATFSKTAFEPAARFIVKLAEEVLRRGLPEGTLLNVNVPAVPQEEIRGIRMTRQGKGGYTTAFDKRNDLHNRTYYWQGGKHNQLDFGLDVDDSAVMENYISVTPVHYDLTNHAFLKDLQAWHLQL